MGFNPIFYAGRTKLSQVTIDSDLDMGGRNISGVDALHVGRLGSPFTPQVWPTETLEWADGVASEVFDESKGLTNSWEPAGGQWTPYVTPAGASGRKYTFTIQRTSGTSGYNRLVSIKILINSVEVVDVTGYSLPDITGSWTHTLWVDPEATVEVRMLYQTSGSYSDCQLVIVDTGIAGGLTTFDLSGKWLALGLDLNGLSATIKIQGVEIPYSDYAKYFPLAPSEITILGDWDEDQIRPDVEVYT